MHPYTGEPWAIKHVRQIGPYSTNPKGVTVKELCNHMLAVHDVRDRGTYQIKYIHLFHFHKMIRYKYSTVQYRCFRSRNEPKFEKLIVYRNAKYVIFSDIAFVFNGSQAPLSPPFAKINTHAPTHGVMDLAPLMMAPKADLFHWVLSARDATRSRLPLGSIMLRP